MATNNARGTNAFNGKLRFLSKQEAFCAWAIRSGKYFENKIPAGEMDGGALVRFLQGKKASVWCQFCYVEKWKNILMIPRSAKIDLLWKGLHMLSGDTFVIYKVLRKVSSQSKVENAGYFKKYWYNETAVIFEQCMVFQDICLAIADNSYTSFAMLILGTYHLLLNGNQSIRIFVKFRRVLCAFRAKCLLNGGVWLCENLKLRK